MILCADIDSERENVAHRRLRTGSAGQGCVAGPVPLRGHVRDSVAVPAHGDGSRSQRTGVQSRGTRSGSLLLLPVDRLPGSAGRSGRVGAQHARTRRGARSSDEDRSGPRTSRFPVPLSRYSYSFKLIIYIQLNFMIIKKQLIWGNLQTEKVNWIFI